MTPQQKQEECAKLDVDALLKAEGEWKD